MLRSNDILLAHPGKQHAYEVAVALQERGRLLSFVTGIYDTPDSWLGTAARAASHITGGERIERLLSKRRHPALDPTGVTTWPLAELVSRTVGQLGPVQVLTRRRSGYLFANWFFDLAVARALRDHRYQPTAVYAFLGAALHTFAACRELGIQTILDVPIVLSATKTLEEERRALGLKTREPPMSKNRLFHELMNADRVIAPSRAVAQSVCEVGYVGGISEVPFGADLDVFRPYAVRGDAFRVVYAGRIEMRKGVHYLVQAWHDSGVSGELLLAGSPGEAEFVERVRQQYGPGVREAGNLTKFELAHLFATGDVFVMPSLAEGSALVTYEALAAGLPSVVTREAGSVVRDGIEGFVVPARDPGALASRIRQLHDNSALRRQMSIAARARAEEFSWAAYRQRLLAAIDSALTPAQPVQSAIA